MLLVIFALVGIGYVLISGQGGGYVDLSTGNGPRSSSTVVNQLATGIAHAEGYYRPLSRPARNHNPGDITDSFGMATGKDSGGLSIFPDDQTGWDALTHKLENILAGTSTVYFPSEAITQLAQTWTDGDNPGPWAQIVVSHLNAAGIAADQGTALQDLAVG